MLAVVLFTEHLLYAKFCVKNLKHIAEFEPYNNPKKQILLGSLFYKWGNRNSEKQNNLISHNLYQIWNLNIGHSLPVWFCLVLTDAAAAAVILSLG